MSHLQYFKLSLDSFLKIKTTKKKQNILLQLKNYR